MKVYRVVKKELRKLRKPYKFLDGDVYVVKTDSSAWVWVGKRSFADDKCVGAWMAKSIKDEKENLEVKTILQGEEPEEFKQLFNFKVVQGDTPGFLEDIDVKPKKDFQLLQIKQDESDNLLTYEIPIDYRAFDSDDCFVLDAYDEIYVWIVKDSHVKEKYQAARIARLLDTERKRTPIVYTIEEGNEPEGFREFVIKTGWKDGILEYRNR
jgi:hypothetical protein